MPNGQDDDMELAVNGDHNVCKNYLQHIVLKLKGDSTFNDILPDINNLLFNSDWLSISLLGEKILLKKNIKSYIETSNST